MRFTSLLTCLFAVALALTGSAWSADLSEAQIRDGLSKLAAQLAPDVPKNARWVKVEPGDYRFGIFAPREDAFSSDGNALLLDEKPGKEARIMTMYDNAVVKVKTDAQEADDDPYTNRARDMVGTWKNADVAKDAASAIEWIKRMSKNAKPGTAAGNDPFGGSDRDDPAAIHNNNQQCALLWAAALMHTGHEAPALALATAAFTGTDEPRRKDLLDTLFDRLASQSYCRTMAACGAHHDWNRLRDALDGLLQRFPHGWQMRDAVRVFRHHVAERAKLPASPPLKTKTPANAADQKVLLDWFKELEAGKHTPYDIWTLPPAPDAENGGRQIHHHATEPAFPRSHGLAAVPLLAALLTDDTLTLVNTGDQMPHESHFWSGNEQDPAERLRTQYGNLHKPPTRAQLAWNALQRVIPQELRRMDGENPAEAIPDILAWHAKVKSATPADLALDYIESGKNDDIVLAHAARVEDPKKLARVESAMVEGVDIWELNNLQSFVEKLGPERGVAFIGKVRQKLEGDLSRYQSDAGQMERQRKQMESGLKRLETAAKGEKKDLKLADLLALMIPFDPEAEDADQGEMQDAFQKLPKLAKSLPAAERITSLVNALPQFKSRQLAAQMLSFMWDGGPEPLPKLKPDEKKTVLEATRPQWQKLLGTRPTVETQEFYLQALNALQDLADIKTTFPLEQLAEIGDHGIALLHERATALLAGQKPADLPDPAAIKAPEREKLYAEWSTKSPADLAAGLATLEIDKLIALNEQVARTVTQRPKELPPGLVTHMNTVHSIVTKSADEATWTSWKGKALDKDSLLSLARDVSATKSVGALTVGLIRSSPLRGLTLYVTESQKIGHDWQLGQLRAVASQFDNGIPARVQRATTAYFQVQRVQQSWQWLDSPAFDQPASKATNTDKERSRIEAAARNAWDKVVNSLDAARVANRFFINFATAPVSLIQKADE